MPVLRYADDSRLPEFLRDLKDVHEFQPGDVIQDTDVIGWPEDLYGHPAGGGYRIVQYRIIKFVSRNGGITGTLWTFMVEDIATGIVSKQQFTELILYKVIR